MLLKMLGTHEASKNGTHVETFLDGAVYFIPDPLGSMLLAAGWAERFTPESTLAAMHEAVKDVATKMQAGSPENKASSPRAEGGRRSRQRKR